jgi:hypothetical protein
LTCILVVKLTILVVLVYTGQHSFYY